VGSILLLILCTTFTYFGMLGLLNVFQRVANYLTLVNALTIAYSLAGGRSRGIKLATLAIVATSLIAGALVVSYVVTDEHVMFYRSWLYKEGEVLGFEDVERLTPRELRLISDVKTSYFMWNRDVDRNSLLKIAYTGSMVKCDYAIVVHRDLYEYGYVEFVEVHKLSKLFEGINNLNRTYDGQYVWVWTCQ